MNCTANNSSSEGCDSEKPHTPSKCTWHFQLVLSSVRFHNTFTRQQWTEKFLQQPGGHIYNTYAWRILLVKKEATWGMSVSAEGLLAALVYWTGSEVQSLVLLLSWKRPAILACSWKKRAATFLAHFPWDPLGEREGLLCRHMALVGNLALHQKRHNILPAALHKMKSF